MSLRKAFCLIILGLAVTACSDRQPTARDNTHSCQNLQAGIETTANRLAELRKLREAIPKDVSDPAFLSGLDEFTKLNAEIIRDVDALFAENEIPCKTDFVLRNQFDNAMEQVYRPYIQIHLAVLQEEKAFLEQLKAMDSEAVLGSLIQATEALVTGMESTLRGQRSVCNADFTSPQCQAFTQQIDSILPKTPETVQENSENPIEDEDNQKENK